MSSKEENKRALSIISKLDGSKKRKTHDDGAAAGDDVVNVRKAIRHASKGKGGVALAHKAGGKSSFGKKGKR